MAHDRKALACLYLPICVPCLMALQSNFKQISGSPLLSFLFIFCSNFPTRVHFWVRIVQWFINMRIEFVVCLVRLVLWPDEPAVVRWKKKKNSSRLSNSCSFIRWRRVHVKAHAFFFLSWRARQATKGDKCISERCRREKRRERKRRKQTCVFLVKFEREQNSTRYAREHILQLLQ